ncbi:hypothetical protein PG996_007849 [Apiospora saccharicola]|uniref:Putative gamma-glutamylcyclotransferase n=1 Tax=Apiospora saccharicola TaxID=335842 RepID=A0ABR1UW96_9PEZI
MADVTETDEEREARQPLQGIPPAPPLPTSPLTSVSPPPPPPPGTNNAKSIQQSVMASKFAAFEKATTPTFAEPTTFRPRHFFFYGTLMDPEVYQTVTKSPEAPAMRKGRITGFRMKMWGIYPTLVQVVPGSSAGPEAETDTRITGTYCMVDSHVHLDNLQYYETTKYKPVDCTIMTEEGEELTNCATFGWAGDPDSAELEDGVFDFERYQKYFKPSVVKRSAAP